MPNTALAYADDDVGTFTPLADAADDHLGRYTYPPLPLDILLVEDDASDAALTEEAFDETQISYEMHTLSDGQDVLDYLKRKGKYRKGHKPDLLLLDLSLPRKDGFEVLAELAEQSQNFGNLPIVILTGDAHSAFLKYSYGLQIASYITKPCTAAKIQGALKAVAQGGRNQKQ